MKDNLNQQPVLSAAGRAAALLLSLIVFAAIWESDSSRDQTEQLAGQINRVPTDSKSGIPIETGSTIELEQTLRRNNGFVRVRLQLDSVPNTDSAQRSLNGELVFHGDVKELRSELVKLLKQLETTSRIVPASGNSKTGARLESTEPQPVDPVVAANSETVLDADSGIVPHPRSVPAGETTFREKGSTQDSPFLSQRGFIFLSRKPLTLKAGEESLESSEDHAELENDRTPVRRPRLLKWSLLRQRSSQLQ